MKRTTQLLGATSCFALIAMTSAPALAEGTSAGDTITNNVSVTYQVGGVQQNAETASDTFTVDRKINVDVEFVGASPTSVGPGEANVALAFDVTNLSNAEVDLELTALLNGGTGADADIDDENFTYYIDVNDDGELDAGDTLVTGGILDDVAEDETVAVIVVTDIGLDAVNGNTFDIVLTADALEDDGSEIVATAGANTAGVDTVLADLAGTTDSANEGDHSDIGSFQVSGANITVAKSSTVISDPVNLTTNPKAIPGATIEYCITVANAASAATATAVSVLDELPADVTFVVNSIFINGDASCANGSVGGTFTESTIAAPTASGFDEVSGSLTDIPSGVTRSLYFRVTIN